jgi:hypothetical protein
MRVGRFVGGPLAASTQHRSAIRQQIRGQQAAQQAPRAAHGKLWRSPRSEVETVAFKQASAVNRPSSPDQPASASRGAVLAEHGWRAAGLGWRAAAGCGGSAAAHGPRRRTVHRGAAAEPASSVVAYQPYDALALALASPAAARWPARLAAAVPRSIVSSRHVAAAAAHGTACHSHRRPMRPHAPVIGGGGHPC